MLDIIERVGNKVPHPAILFLSLCVGVIILSQILYLAGARITTDVVQPPPAAVQEEYVGGSVLPAEILPAKQAPADSYRPVHETARVQGLLTIEGIRYLFTSFVSNFLGFTAMGIILVIMIGVGVAETSGLIASLIRKLVARSPPWSLTYIIVFLGIISSIASDAGYLVLIPLGAAAFKSLVAGTPAFDKTMVAAAGTIFRDGSIMPVVTLVFFALLWFYDSRKRQAGIALAESIVTK